MVGYNLKIEQFYNGAVQITYFPTGVNVPLDGEMSLRKDYFSSTDKDIRKTENHLVAIDNPFTEESEFVLDLDKSEEIEKAHERSLYESLKRTRKMLYRYSRCAEWDYFITLTFSPDKVDRYDFSACMSKARKWCNNQRTRYASDLQYLLVPEQHKDGAWHIHGLLAQCDGMSFMDSGKKVSGQIIYNLTGWRYGFSTATQIMDLDKCSSYICKYITKELCEIAPHKHKYYISNNLYPVEESYLLCMDNNIDDVINQIVDSIGCDFQYEKEINGYYPSIYKFYKVERKNEHGKEN